MTCYATELGIDHLNIPPGSTDEFQPFNPLVFGVMKANGCRLHRAHVAELGAIDK
jgi:hypothetical protein